MTRVITQQSAGNIAYVRRLFRKSSRDSPPHLELALMMSELELTSPEMPGQVSASEGSWPGTTRR